MLREAERVARLIDRLAFLMALPIPNRPTSDGADRHRPTEAASRLSPGGR